MVAVRFAHHHHSRTRSRTPNTQDTKSRRARSSARCTAQTGHPSRLFPPKTYHRQHHGERMKLMETLSQPATPPPHGVGQTRQNELIAWDATRVVPAALAPVRCPNRNGTNTSNTVAGSGSDDRFGSENACPCAARCVPHAHPPASPKYHLMAKESILIRNSFSLLASPATVHRWCVCFIGSSFRTCLHY